MTDTRYQDLSREARRDLLGAAELRGAFRAYLLEKDVWVVATLGLLFESPFASTRSSTLRLVFDS